MPSFTFRFPATSPSGKPTPTKEQLATTERVLGRLIGATTLSLSLANNGDDTGVFTATGTTDNLGDLEEKVDEALDDLAPIAGWVASGPMEAFGQPGDPEAPDGGRRRRSSSKRVRKVTRRHRHRKGSRKLRSKLL